MRARVLILCFFLLGSSSFADSWDENIKLMTGLRGGVCVIPFTDDADSAVALAKESGFVVLAQNPDIQKILSMRELAMRDNMLAEKVYFVHSDAKSLNVMNDFADVVLMADADDSLLTAELAAEIQRVLSPGRGCAVIGSKGGGDALKSWAVQLPGAEVQSGDSGAWLVYRQAGEEGAGQWTHRYHGPNNIRVSTDKTLKAPIMANWWGLPLHEGYWGTTLVAGNGRSYSVGAERMWRTKLKLIARSLHNGTILWERPFEWKEPRDKYEAGFYPGRSSMIVEGDTLWIIDDSDMLQLDGETGGELQRVVGPDTGGQIKWAVVADGKMALLAGPMDEYKPGTLQTLTKNPYGQKIGVYDTDNGELLWSADAEGDVDERSIAIAKDRLYFHVQGGATYCLNLEDGSKVWTNDDPKITKLIEEKMDKRFGGFLESQRSMLVHDNAVLFVAVWHKNTVALDPDTGQMLWHAETSRGWGRAVKGFVYDDKWFDNGVYDLKTGEQVSDARVPSSGCGPSTAADGIFVTAFGSIQDAEHDETLHISDVKPSCDLGAVIAEGMIVNPGGICRCNMELQGFRAMGSADGFDLASAPEIEDRLRRAEGYERVAAVLVDEKDWPCLRRDVVRSGKSEVSVPDNAKILWTYRPQTPINWELTDIQADRFATAPVAAANRIWFADALGTVRCLDDTGAELWNYPTGYKVFVSPELADGRLFVGTGDGKLVALEAATGRLLWEFLAAPVREQTRWYGHIVNRWPVLGGAVVKGDTVYTAAGFQDCNGLHVYALNAQDGSVKWESHDGVTGGEFGLESAWGLYGNLAVGAGRLWVQTSTLVPGSYDLETGAHTFTQDSGDGRRRGKNLTVLADKWVIPGGRRMSSTHAKWSDTDRRVGLSAIDANYSGGEAMAGVTLHDNSLLAPVWDDELIVMASDGSDKIVAYNLADLDKTLDKVMVDQKKKPSRRFPVPMAELTPKGKPSLFPEPKWGPLELMARSQVLTENAVVFGAAITEPMGKRKKVVGWQVVAVSREDGAQLWNIPLEVEPVMDAIAVDREGRVLLPLRDGSMVCIGQ